MSGTYCQVDLPKMSETPSLSSRGRWGQDASARNQKLIETVVLKFRMPHGHLGGSVEYSPFSLGLLA